MRDRLIALVLRRPALVVATALLAVGLSLARLVDPASGALRLGIDTTLDSLLPRDGAALATYIETARQFGSDDVVYVAWLSDTLFTYDVLQGLKRLARDLTRVEGVHAVDSLAGATRVRVDDDLVEVTRLLGRLPRSADGLAALAADARADPLHGPQLLAPDGSGTLLVVRLDAGLDSAALAGALDAVRAAVDARASGLPVQAIVSGPVVARLALGEALFRDVRRALPLAVLVTALIAVVTLRSVRGVVLPLAATATALVTTLAVFAARGHALNFVTVIVPPVVFVVGFAMTVHVINAFDHAFRSVAARRAAVVETMRELWQPLSLTAFTTAIGFASLASSNIDSIRTFGLYTALGTLVAWLAALFFIPAALALWPARVLERATTSRLTALAPALARFDLRHRRAILGAALVLALASLALASRIEVSTDYLANFPPDSQVRRDYDSVRHTFGGANPLQIVVSSDLPQAFADPVHLAAIDTLEQALEDDPDISGVASIVDFIATARRALAPDDASPRRVPESRAAVDDIMRLGAGEARDRFVDARFATTVLHVTTPAVATSELARAVSRIET
ncbi:MAG: MMPL family transporter, partial [Gammaproteobacteria bacterium]